MDHKRRDRSAEEDTSTLSTGENWAFQMPLVSKEGEMEAEGRRVRRVAGGRQDGTGRQDRQGRRGRLGLSQEPKGLSFLVRSRRDSH